MGWLDDKAGIPDLRREELTVLGSDRFAALHTLNPPLRNSWCIMSQTVVDQVLVSNIKEMMTILEETKLQ